MPFAALSTVPDKTPTAFVELLIELSREVAEQTEATRRNRETLLVTGEYVQWVTRALQLAQLTPLGSCSLMVALHRAGYTLHAAREMVAKYGFDNKMKQLLRADTWAQQIDAVHHDLLAVRVELVEGLRSTVLLLEEPIEGEEDFPAQVEQLAKEVEDRQAADLKAQQEWRTSAYINPQAGPGKDGRMEVVTKSTAAALSEGQPSKPASHILSLGQAGHWPVAVAHLEAHPEDVAAHGEIYGLLHHAVLWENAFAVASLLRLGADVNVRTLEYDTALFLPKNSTPLHLAAEIGSETLCRLLICSGADTTLEDDWGRRPAGVETSDEVLKILGDDALAERGRYVAESARELQFGPVLGLIEAGHPIPMDIRASPTSDYFLMHHAARSGHRYLYALALANGASPLLRTSRSHLLASDILAGEATLQDMRESALAVEAEAQRRLEDEWASHGVAVPATPEKPSKQAETKPAAEAGDEEPAE